MIRAWRAFRSSPPWVQLMTAVLIVAVVVLAVTRDGDVRRSAFDAEMARIVHVGRDAHARVHFVAHPRIEVERSARGCIRHYTARRIEGATCYGYVSSEDFDAAAVDGEGRVTGTTCWKVRARRTPEGRESTESRSDAVLADAGCPGAEG